MKRDPLDEQQKNEPIDTIRLTEKKRRQLHERILKAGKDVAPDPGKATHARSPVFLRKTTWQRTALTVGAALCAAWIGTSIFGSLQIFPHWGDRSSGDFSILSSAPGSRSSEATLSDPDENTGQSTSDLTPSTDSTPSSADSSPKPTAGQIKASVPSWYAPGSLSLMTLVHPNAYLGIPDTRSSATGGSFQRLSSSPTGPVNVGLSLGVARTTSPIVRLSSAAIVSRNLSLPAGMVSDPNRTRWADYVTLASAQTYPDESGLYFHLPDSRIIRFFYEAKAVLSKASKIPSGGYIQLLHSDPSTGHAIVEVRSASHATVGAFYFNYYDKRVAALPVEVVNSTFTISPDGHNLAMNLTDSQGMTELMLLDLSRKSPALTCVTDGRNGSFRPSERLFFTESGKYLVYGTADDTGNFFDANNVPYLAVYDIAKKNTIRTSGHFIRSIRDDAFLVLEKDGKGMVVRSDTGADAAGSLNLESWEAQRIQIDMVKIKGGAFRQTATKIPLFGIDSPALSFKEAGAVLVSGPYLYAYVAGSNVIQCLHTGTGDSFDIPIDMSFVNEIRGLKAKGLEATFYFTLSRDRSLLLLQYTAQAYQDEQAFGPYDMNDGFWEEFLASEDLSGLKDYVDGGNDLKLGEEYGESNPYVGTKRFYIVAGDGYTSLIAVSETDFKIAVEDYRDRSFTLYRAVNTEAWFAPPQLYDVTGDNPSIPVSSFRKRLSPSVTAQSSRERYAGLPRLAPYYDYADFYTAGALDPEKIRLWRLRPELADAAFSIRAGIADVASYVDGERFGSFITDREMLATLLTEIAALPGMKPLSDERAGLIRFPALGSSYWTGKERMEYYLSISAERRLSNAQYEVYGMHMGMDSEGRYYLYTQAGYWFLTKAQHDRLFTLCRTLHQAATLNP